MYYWSELRCWTFASWMSFVSSSGSRRISGRWFCRRIRTQILYHCHPSWGCTCSSIASSISKIEPNLMMIMRMYLRFISFLGMCSRWSNHVPGFLRNLSDVVVWEPTSSWSTPCNRTRWCSIPTSRNWSHIFGSHPGWPNSYDPWRRTIRRRAVSLFFYQYCTE